MFNYLNITQCINNFSIYVHILLILHHQRLARFSTNTVKSNLFYMKCNKYMRNLAKIKSLETQMDLLYV